MLCLKKSFFLKSHDFEIFWSKIWLKKNIKKMKRCEKR